MVKGIVGCGEMSLLLELRDDLYHDLGALLIGEAMLEVMESLQEACAHVLHLPRALPRGRLHIGLLRFTHVGRLHPHLNTINACPIGDDRRHHRLKPRQASLDIVVTLGHPVNFWSPLVMRQRPIETHDLTALPAMLLGHDSPMAGHQRLSVPLGFEHRGMHRPAARALGVPDVQVIDPLYGFVGAKKEPSDRTADVGKPLVSAKEVAIGSQALLDRRWHSTDGQQSSGVLLSAWFPCLYSCRAPSATELAKSCLDLERSPALSGAAMAPASGGMSTQDGGKQPGEAA